MNTVQSLYLTLDEVLLSLGGLVMLLIAAWGGVRSARAVSIVGVALLVGAAFLAATARGEAFGGLVHVDGYAAFAKLLIYGTGAVALMVAPRWLEREGAMRAEYPVLIIYACVGLAIMVMAADFLTLYIGLELNSLASYVLAAYVRSDQRSSESGLKYFVLGALASGILLFGTSLVYGFTGSTGFATVATALDGPLGTGAMFGLVFVFAGLAFKIAAVPFHMWTPDVYEGAPTPVTTFFASAANVGATALIVRVAVEAFGAQQDAWQPIVIVLALASIILGAVGAIGQQSLKRLMAYSSINNIGFILIGLAAGTREGVAGVLQYLAIYVVMTVGSFACIMALGRNRDRLADISGLSRTRPLLAACLAIFMFSLAGIPPLYGFWAKLVIFQATVKAGLLPLAFIGIAASVIGAYYYLKVVKTMYFDDPAEATEPPGATLTIVAGAGALFILLGIFLVPLGAASVAAAGSLF